MEKSFLAKAGFLLSLLSIVVFLLTGCAYSRVERHVTSDIDKGVERTRLRIDASSRSTMADSWANANQQSKGAVTGGVIGGIYGYFTSTVGMIPGLLVGSMFGASYGSYIDSKTTIADQLQNRGATIVVLGDQILIVLPSARIFEPMSSRIKPDAYCTLDLVARYINGFTKMLVKIATFTNPMRSSEVAICLSKEQAESVARYLAATGMDSRVLYAVGYGGMSPVQYGGYSFQENDNYRIEITLEKLYV